MNRVHPAVTDEIDQASLTPVLRAFAQFVRKLGAGEQTAIDERSTRRYPLRVPVHVVPVDDALKRMERPFVGETRNISTGGLAFVHTHPISTAYFLVTIDADEFRKMRLLMKVLRRRRTSKLFEFAGKFLARVDE